MKAAAFDYHHADDVSEAIRLLGEADGAGKLLAGGQSLGPMLNLRLVRVGLLVDIRRVESLRGVSETPEAITYGAAVTHSEFEDGIVPDAANGLLRHVGAGIAYRAVRNRGTVGGSLVHADPAADWLSAFVALDARLHMQGQAGSWTVALSEAVTGAFTLNIGEDDILTGIEVPRLSADARWGWCKINSKAGEFADAIGVAVIDRERDYARVVCGALDAPPLILDARTDDEATIKPALSEALPDLPAVDRHLHAVALKRAVRQAVAA